MGEPQAAVGRSPMVGRTLTTTANLAKLLPTGTVLAFQSLNASFTNRGTCYAADRYLTLALITCCSLSCAFFSFTDSFIGPDGDLHAGVATFRSFHILSLHGDEPKGEERKRWKGAMEKLKIQFVDYVHAFFSVLVFLALALSDSTVQSCLFEKPTRDTKEYLVNLPLGAGFLASVVFAVFPSSRRGIGYSDMTPGTLNVPTGGVRAPPGTDPIPKPAVNETILPMTQV